MKKSHFYISTAMLIVFILVCCAAIGDIAWFKSWKLFGRADTQLCRYAALACSFEPSFEPSGGVIFKIPAMAPDNTLLRGAFDRVVAECSSGALVTSLIPSGESFRKESIERFSGFSGCELKSGGALLFFYCYSGKSIFSRIYTNEHGLLPMPAGGVK